MDWQMIRDERKYEWNFFGIIKKLRMKLMSF